MVPRWGQKYKIEIKTISEPIAESQTDEYFDLDLPAAPAVMVGDKTVRKARIWRNRLERMIRQHPGLPEPGPP